MEGAQATVSDEKTSFDWGIVFWVLFCLFLGGAVCLFIRNNHLLAYGGRNLWNPEALIMLGVLGIPFLLSLLHLVRIVRRQRQPHA
jgi:hypothetical protein